LASLSISFLALCSFLPCLLPSFPTRRSSDLAEPLRLRLRRGAPLRRVRRGPGGFRGAGAELWGGHAGTVPGSGTGHRREQPAGADRKSTRLNSSHVSLSYAVFCLKNKKEK